LTGKNDRSITIMDLYCVSPEIKPTIIVKLKTSTETTAYANDVDYCVKVLHAYQNLCLLIKERKGRNINFPEIISELLVKLIIQKIERIQVTGNCSGDLQTYPDRIPLQVKCWSSTGPISFGPLTKWERLYLLDATKYRQLLFKCYRVNVSSDDQKYLSLKVSTTESVQQQSEKMRRPRIQPLSLLQQLGSSVIFNGHINDLLL